MIKFLNECLICFIPQLRHFDGCAIKAPPSIRDVFQREIEMRLQMEILYSFYGESLQHLLRPIGIPDPKL